ncbi:SCO family protein [Herbaspirillum sp. VT-16-41]|uniref:SCO family protein n=1 Tax=Herbaspirillum sp. VT-16-41 TaxID=1953765 RepID=UPI0009822118|nr:SCO family protein [Herbaspirillum sp. VT-16-41]ONN64946.1 SCO family protein [Herbaspirillum sp. VT-16-41]
MTHIVFNKLRLLLPLLAACLFFVACSPRGQLSPSSIDLKGEKVANDFQLRDPDGKTRTMADFRGKVVMLFFGYTQCPDVCPTALARAVAVKNKLAGDATELQVIFVTVDPERDTPEIMKSYTTAFDPSFIGLSGDMEMTRKTADAFRVFYQKVPTKSSYTMDHTAVTYLLDPKGEMRVAIKPDASADEIAHDVHFLLNDAT